jgi:hypothetical protein
MRTPCSPSTGSETSKKCQGSENHVRRIREDRNGRPVSHDVSGELDSASQVLDLRMRLPYSSSALSISSLAMLRISGTLKRRPLNCSPNVRTGYDAYDRFRIPRVNDREPSNASSVWQS